MAGQTVRSIKEAALAEVDASAQPLLNPGEQVKSSGGCGRFAFVSLPIALG